jgi:hypothetical protein
MTLPLKGKQESIIMRSLRFWLIGLMSCVLILASTLYAPAVAFKPNIAGEGHWGITEDALTGPWKTPSGSAVLDERGRPMGFTSEAIEEIYQANRGVDLAPDRPILPDMIPSDDFEIPENHFDNELFELGSVRLRNLKQQVIRELSVVRDLKDDCHCASKDEQEANAAAGRAARRHLGQALHTLQDFYAHSNWVELGFHGAEIDRRLGRSIVPNPPVGFKPALPGDPSALSPTVVGSRKVTNLTSGYFMGVLPPAICDAPAGKVRHGASVLGITCAGLNKDESALPGYPEAQELALNATRDFVNQIIAETPAISGNIYRIKALMGIRTPCRKDPKCKQLPNNSNIGTPTRSGRSHGDPHIATVDGYSYSLQTVGEAILIKSNDGTFEVQERHSPMSASMSLNTAVAIKAGPDRVALYTREVPDGNNSNPLWVNGQPVTLQQDKLDLLGGGTIVKQGRNYVVHAPSGENVVISYGGSGDRTFLNISPFVYNQSGQYSGLLGNVNGNPKDDLQIRGGAVISETQSNYGDVKQVFNLTGLRLPGALDKVEKLYFDKLYKEFAQSWAVKPEESLFDYPTGKTTKNYTDPAFPDKYLTLNMLSAKQIKQAREACTQAKVTEDLMEGCIFDVGFSGFSDFARAAAEISGYISLVNQLVPGVNIPTPEKAVERAIEKVKPKVCLPFIGCR